MDSADKSKKSPGVSNSSIDDIPVAFRDTPASKPESNYKVVIWAAGLTGVGLFALIAGTVVSLYLRNSETPTLASENSAQATPAPASTSAASDNELPLLNHLPYAEAPQADLSPIADDSKIKLRKAAAASFQAMTETAQQSGVSLVPISGFRSKTDQNHLFFDVKAERGQVAAERAKVSAPPGYSEHHTGYAIDIGDGEVPATDLSQDFEKTKAFRWLQANAARFSFELSFPKNNRQGVSYEPWHWRFVGDRQSLETFYKARSTK